jgi:GTPase SAR1 family protein
VANRQTDTYVILSQVYDQDSLKSAIRAVQEMGGKTLMYSKISVIGEGRAGKTSLIHAMLGHEFRDHESTIGISSSFIEVVQHNVHGSFSGSLEDQKGAEWRSHQPGDCSVVEEAKHKLIAAKIRGKKIKESPTIFERMEASSPKKASKRRPAGSLSSPIVPAVSTFESVSAATPSRSVSADSPSVSAASPSVNENLRDQTEDEVPAYNNALIDKFLKSESSETESLKLLLEDFGGQNIFYDLYSILFSEYGVYILVFNMKWLMEGCERRDDALSYLRYWLSTVAIHTVFRGEGHARSCAPVFLVGTHKDEVALANEHESIDKILSEELNGIPSWSAINEYKQESKTMHFFPVNNKVGIVDPVLVQLMQEIHACMHRADHLKHKIPFKWMALMDEFEKLKVENKYAIKLEVFKALCEDQLKFPSNPHIDLDSEIQMTLNFFDKLGIIMYKNCTPDLVLIHPAKFLFPYITKVICDFQIHSSLIPEHKESKRNFPRQWKLLTEKGILSKVLLSTLWKDCNYAEHIQTLMVLFGLMVPILDKEDDAAETFLVPSILPKKDDIDCAPVHQTNLTLFALFSESDIIDLWQRHGFATIDEIRSDGFLPQGVFSRLVGSVAELCQLNPPYESIDLMSLFQNYASFTLGSFAFTLSKHPKYIKFHIQGISAVELVCRFEYYLTIILEKYMPGLHYLLAVPADGGRDPGGYQKFAGNLTILNGGGGIIEREMNSKTMRISATEVLDAADLRKRFDGWLGQRGFAEKYDFFYSYRWGGEEFDSELVMNMFTTVGCRQCKGRAIVAFLDKRRLEPGSNFVQDFCNGLFNTKVAVPIVSAHALDKMSTLSPDSDVDNLLLEWMLMLEMRGKNGCALKRIIPVLVGEMLEVPNTEGELMQSFFSLGCIGKLPDCICHKTLAKAKDILKLLGLSPSPELEKQTVQCTVKSLLEYLGIETWKFSKCRPEHHTISHHRAHFYRNAAIKIVDELVQKLEWILNVENAQNNTASLNTSSPAGTSYQNMNDMVTSRDPTKSPKELALDTAVVAASMPKAVHEVQMQEKVPQPDTVTTRSSAISPACHGTGSVQNQNSNCCCAVQ